MKRRNISRLFSKLPSLPGLFISIHPISELTLLQRSILLECARIYNLRMGGTPMDIPRYPVELSHYRRAVSCLSACLCADPATADRLCADPAAANRHPASPDGHPCSAQRDPRPHSNADRDSHSHGCCQSERVDRMGGPGHSQRPRLQPGLVSGRTSPWSPPIPTRSVFGMSPPAAKPGY